MISKKKIVSISLAGLLVYMAFVFLESCNSSSDKKEVSQVNNDGPATFTGSASCQSCHTQEYADWKKSDHYLAMSQANDSTVLGDFNNTSFTADGVTNRFFKKDGKFYINTQGEDGKNHDYEVLYTFGYFPLQQYLIAFSGGRLQSTRVSWDSREKKWFHQYAGQNIHHKDWLHWTGNSQNGNTMCISCHTTNLQKNYDFALDSYNTTWNEINVSCESCHGPGSTHISFLNSSAYKKGNRLSNSGFLYSNSTNPQLQLNTCAPCHARKTDLAKELLHSDEIMDDMIPQIISNEFYFADGQCCE